MSSVIEVENISKLYRLGEISTGALVHDLNRWWHWVRGKEDPFRTIGTVNDRTRQSSGNEYVWALKDISFEVEKGDIVGIIGRNGAGKSTLLKILSKVTGPTEGEIRYDGRIASLLEVGTGFHPELTGIENIFLNGTILGMKRREIKTKLDEILEFAGVSLYADTPVKRYSSGMILRLAFAVAANLEAEILIVDEVLAVGDSEFQRKAIGKMEDVSKNAGKTVLFVSHNLSTLRSICKNGILLKNGRVMEKGTIDNVIQTYTSTNASDEPIVDKINYLNDNILVHDLRINGQNSCSVQLTNERELQLEVDLEFKQETRFELDMHLTKNEQVLASYSNFVFNEPRRFEKGRYIIKYSVRLPEMRSGKYGFDLYFTDPYTCWFSVCKEQIELNIINSVHNTFLNVPSLRWGGVLLNGEFHVVNESIEITRDAE